MKNFYSLLLVLLAILLFFAKEGRAQCDSQGILNYSESGDTYKLFFEKQPWTDCASFGLGWQQPDSISTHWIITNDDCDTLVKIANLPKDTIYFKGNGFFYVTCEVTYHYQDAPTKTSVPDPIWFDASGQDCISILPPDDTLGPIPIDTTATTTTEPAPPQNFYSVQNGVISLEGEKGILVVLDLITMPQVIATDFQGSLIYDLNLCCGSGMYLCYVVFTSPYENVDLGVISI